MAGKRGRPRTSYAAAKRAFIDVFGDPYGQPEPTVGHYQTYKGRSLVQAMKNNFDEGKATRNPASPNGVDFYCDVERVLETTLSGEELETFLRVYIDEDLTALNETERTSIELRIGRVLRERGISPVRRYFTSIRRSQGK